VDDLIDLYERALERIDLVAGEVFNIGGGPALTLSLNELVAKLEQALGRDLDSPLADWRPGDQRVFVADIRKARRLLGWAPRVAPDEGVEMLLDWVCENRALFGPPPLKIAPSQADHTGLAA
jgi:CDP-paratose 2-epimerase